MKIFRKSLIKQENMRNKVVDQVWSKFNRSTIEIHNIEIHNNVIYGIWNHLNHFIKHDYYIKDKIWKNLNENKI